MDPARMSMLALVFVGLRILHGVFYVAGIAALRSLAWAGGVTCVVALMVQAALKAS